MAESNHQISIAVLDLYEGQANQGMRCIRQIIKQWGVYEGCDVHYKEYDVRLKNEVPDTSYDLYISSGGPGSPLESEGTTWESCYFDWLQKIEDWNSDTANNRKKYIFFICHSFQLAARHYNIGKVCRRISTAFGAFPMHMMKDGLDEPVFGGLKDPFYGVDSRDYQVISPNHDQLSLMGASVLAIEKERPHVPYERAIMAMRFNNYFIGTQFHPEADALGMTMYLQREDKKKTVIENHGEEKWKSMIERLNDPDKIMLTYKSIIPNFLTLAAQELAVA